MFRDRHQFLARWEGPVTAVASWRATAEDRGRALPRLKAHRIVAALARDTSREDVMALHRIATGVHPSPVAARGVATRSLAAQIRAAFDRDRLLLLGGWDLGGNLVAPGGAGDGAGSSDQKLARQAMGDRRDITFEGRRYRLVPAGPSSRGATSGDFRPVPIAEARDTVARMLGPSNHLAPQEQKVWEEVARNLSDGKTETGLLLLRHRPAVGASPRPLAEPAITPSQMRDKIAEQSWIEIEVVYDDGSPFDGNCAVELPDGRKTEGPPGEDAIVRIEGLDPGSCKVSFPALDASAWNAG